MSGRSRPRTSARPWTSPRSSRPASRSTSASTSTRSTPGSRSSRSGRAPSRSSSTGGSAPTCRSGWHAAPCQRAWNPATAFTPGTVTVTGPSEAVHRVVAVRVSVALDPGGIDFDRDVEANPDRRRRRSGAWGGRRAAYGPRDRPAVHQQGIARRCPSTRSSPGCRPRASASPASGRPAGGPVEGDADGLESARPGGYRPVAVFGTTRDVRAATVALALPHGRRRPGIAGTSRSSSTWSR